MTWQEIKSKYKTSEIYNLQIVKILHGPQLVLFKIEGYDCRLHVSNIANEPELSNKLFSVINVGDIISVVIIGYNDERQNINLSTNVFRTHLDNILSFTKSKKIIEGNLKTHLSLPSKFLKQNRNILDRLRGDLSSNELTFLYELIQNAVDHPNKNFNNVSVTFEIFDKYLLVKHNGSLFTENNFESITGILAGEEINENDRERIGYKGIGFKSVFRYSHNVYIRSGNFSFSFNKAISGAETPWEVLPVFQLEKDKVEEIQQFDFFNVPVAFAIELINEELKNDVIKYLKQLSQNPYLLIFLENLIRIEIKVPDNYYCLQKEIENQNNFDILTLKSNEVVQGKFLTYSNEYKITNPEVIAELLDENNTAIPSKMRNFRKPKVSIALPLDENLELINLFTYLPLSNTKHGIPYIINADFIPDLDRTDLVRNLKYNSEVLKFASEALISFSQLLINEGRYSDFLKLIPDFENSNINALAIINDNYIENSVVLELPCNDNSKIKKENLIIDKTGIFKIIDEKHLNEIEKYRDKKILSSIINDEENKLQYFLDIEIFDDVDLLELLSLQSIQQIYFTDLKSLISFLFKIRHLESSKKIHSLLKTKVKPFKLNEEYYHLSDITLNIEEVYKETFKYLDLYIPSPKELEEVLVKHSRIKSLFDILSVDEYDTEYTIDLIVKNIKPIISKLSIIESDEIETIEFKKSTLSNLWFFLFINKNLADYRNNLLVNNQFSELLIECNDGQLIVLKDAIMMKVDNSKEDYSFLNERYGDKEMNYVNIDKICIEYKIQKNEFIKFIKQIADIEITENRLFNRTLRKLSKNDFKEVHSSNQNDILNSLISIFNFLSTIKDLDVNRDNLFNFPILCSDNSIVSPAKLNLFIDNSFSKYIDEVDFYSKELFQNIDDVKYISSEYMELLDKKNHIDFYNFLLKFNITPGIKINQLNEKKEFKTYPFPIGNYTVRDNFFYIAFFKLINNKYDNLNIFWNKLINISDYHLIIKKVNTGLTHPKINESLFILFLNYPDNKYFPIKSGICVSAQEVYSPYLEIYLKDNDNCLTFDIKKFNGLAECLNFKDKLDNQDIIKALLSNKEYENNDYKNLIFDHLNNADFTNEQKGIICESIEFRCSDNEYRKITDTIYLDKSLESLPISIISKSNDLYKISIDSLDYNEEFKNKLTELGITVVRDVNLTVNHTKEEIESVIIIKEIQNVVNECFNDKIIAHDISEIEYFFNTYDFVQCSNIEITFDNHPTYSEPVMFYNDQNNKKLFFADEIILLDVLCEEFGINNVDKIVIRKNLNKLKVIKNEENIDYLNKTLETKYTNPNDFSLSEIETLKQIIGGELTEELTSQLEANFSASLKGILNLDNIGFSPSNPEEFRETNVKSFKNDKGEIRNIIFRSSVKGLLYLDPYSWKKLEGDNIELWIYLGNEDFKIIYSKDDLINLPYNPYTLIRVDNSAKDIELVNKLMGNAAVSSTKLLFITNQEMAEKLNTDIFNNENNQITKNSNIGDENYL
ncbi:sacsin N-terminal ATP-binding-like domain-containing protein [Flavobacterium sp. N1994]|uniref:sacsin N-terminal ATP-binding-like domain-containing protein n=1 Tax=Flavobacterium sp. N1994 TaxID=2986827 RepID=UPI002221439B|nr:hypothetical protein [Flavobacterium sp. N1994]